MRCWGRGPGMLNDGNLIPKVGNLISSCDSRILARTKTFMLNESLQMCSPVSLVWREWHCSFNTGVKQLPVPRPKTHRPQAHTTLRNSLTERTQTKDRARTTTIKTDMRIVPCAHSTCTARAHLKWKKVSEQFFSAFFQLSLLEYSWIACQLEVGTSLGRRHT